MASPDTTASMKIESEGVEITEGISAIVIRPENAVALAKIIALNKDAATFINLIDAFDNLKVSFRYGSDAWVKVFDGIVEDTSPILNLGMQNLVATAYGKGRALRNTKCNTSYGVESENPTIDTPVEIWGDIISNYVEKSFGGAATGYTMAESYSGGAAPSINFMFNPYRSNMDIINHTLLLIQANQAGGVGHHWTVDMSGALLVKPLDGTIGVWTKWWDTDQDGSTLVEGTDFIQYSFSKRVRSKDFANKIILSTDMRKPGYDYWAELAAANNLWTRTGNGAEADDAGNKQVGANSLKLSADANQNVYWHFPNAAANWDFTKIGSGNNPPQIKLYARRTANANHAVVLQLRTTDSTNYFHQMLFNTASDTHLMPVAGDWYHLVFPLIGGTPDGWDSFGNPSWSNIDFIAINFVNTGFAGANDFWLDDIHFTGKIIREAYNSTNIAANNEHQKLVRMNSAVDDSMIAATDTGMAAMLAYAELLRAQTIPTIGTVKLYGIVDMWPGMWVHIHAEKTNGTFRIDSDFRVKEVQHEFSGLHEFYTSLMLTDDMNNSFAKGPSEMMSIYRNVVFIDPEAQSLKTTGIDPLVPRLSVDYP